MIIELAGDLMEAKVPVILHGCNAQGVMGSGVAKAIRSTFPEAYVDYMKRYTKNNGLTLGSVVFAEITTHGKLPEYVANCITQQFYGKDGKRYASLDAIRNAFMLVTEFCDLRDISVVATPKIGCGLGGLSWSNEVKDVMERHLLPDGRVYVYDNRGEVVNK